MPHFALIDAARDPMILPLLEQEAQWACLFGGNVPAEVRPKAPYILRLDPGSPFRKTLEGTGWAKHWGITCHAPERLLNVRRELRKNMQARLPAGEVVLFRFYDPRVFVPFLQATEGEALDPWFGLIDTWWAPHPRTGATMKFTRDGEALAVETV